MPRSRNIKPSFFTNDELSECSMAARLLFIGLWTIADREGRLLCRPKKIKAEIFPYDDVDCDALIGELEALGFVERYTIDSVSYMSIPNFVKHQNPHCREAPSVLPKPEKQKTNENIGESASTVQAPASTVQAPEIQERARLIPDSGFLIPERGNQNEENRNPVLAPYQEVLSKHLDSGEFCSAWNDWKAKLVSTNARPIDSITEKSQLYQLERFSTDEAIEIVQFSTSRTKCQNLITNGDHKNASGRKQTSGLAPKKNWY